ncbi:hypothetical protein EV193_106194 [Herbihabitans rhizosphaerae]|uniref:Uncharacterized protein n=1 Tax=Herbihabitans rhizosphaerae TaxID=1872711 RepID=A0A4Q7KK78_9PSEU|nr:hypothetical protein [Herbihabitans rhizosphaerae]RZS36959.1 hypothetical protein EV193_106194 [Herbihabitans rhizosphaerae]
MSYPQQGYPQGYPQDPYGGYGQRQSSPAGVIIAGVLGLALLTFNAFVIIDMIGLMGDDRLRGDPPSEWTFELILYGLAAVLLLVGLILIAVRTVAAAFVLAAGAFVSLAMILLSPVLFADGEFGTYFEVLFDSDMQKRITGDYSLHWIGRMLAMFAALPALVAAVLPPTLNWLKAGKSDPYAGGYPQQPGYGQQQPPQQW